MPFRSSKIRCFRTAGAGILLAVSVSMSPVEAAAQFRMGHAPEDLRSYDWTQWLAGSWEGDRIRSTGERVPFRQSFEFTANDKYLLVHAWEGEQPDGYGGVGLFSYYPTTDDGYGEWFGVNHDWNYGWAERDGERMVWKIYRLGMVITRVRTRISQDEYSVTSHVVHPDGSESRSREEMRRVR